MGKQDVKFLKQNMKDKGIHYRCDVLNSYYSFTVKTKITAIVSIEEIFLEESLTKSRATYTQDDCLATTF